MDPLNLRNTAKNPLLRKQTSTQNHDKTRDNIKLHRDRQAAKKEAAIDGYNAERIVQELKERKLPTFGTFNEKKERLKKHYGIPSTGCSAPPLEKKKSTVEEIEKLRVKREERRKQMEERKRIKSEREIENERDGIRCDVDFQLLMQRHKARVVSRQEHDPSTATGKVSVVVRKRPVFKKEAAEGEIDCVSCTNPGVIVHECKYKVDGVSKYVENH